MLRRAFHAAGIEFAGTYAFRRARAIRYAGRLSKFAKEKRTGNITLPSKQGRALVIDTTVFERTEGP